MLVEDRNRVSGLKADITSDIRYSLKFICKHISIMSTMTVVDVQYNLNTKFVERLEPLGSIFMIAFDSMLITIQIKFESIFYFYVQRKFFKLDKNFINF